MPHRLLAVTLGLALVFLLWPGLDRVLMAPVYLGGNDFLLRGHALSHAYDAVRAVLFPAIGVGVIAAGIAAWARRPWPGLPARRVAAMGAVLIGVVGGVQNLILKNGFGRPRPKNTEAFGGDLPYHPPLLPGGACPGNCSFVSGDVGFVFVVLALAFAVPEDRGAARRAAVAGILALGLLVAAERVLSGSHYPSDVLFAALSTSIAVVWLERAWVRRTGGAA